MFKDNQAFSSFSVADIDVASDFYTRKLGLTAEKSLMGELDLKLAGGQRVMLYQKPNHEPATFTVLNFVVSDIKKAVDDLTAAGIEMRQYDMPEMQQDAKGITRDSGGSAFAWFKDPAGNVLAVMQIPS